MIFLFLQCVSTVIMVYIIISPLNSYLYIHSILDFKYILLLLLLILKKSLYFSIHNGVKQGGVISPIFFNLYLDPMLIRHRESRIGCHINNVLLVLLLMPMT